MKKRLTFIHVCTVGCPVAGSEVNIDSEVVPEGTAFVMPELRCTFTNNVLKLVAIDYNRNV